MKNLFLLSLLCVGTAPVYTAQLPQGASGDSSAKRSRDEEIKEIAAQLQQEVEEDQAITSLAASLREECESDDSLDGNTAAAPATAAQQQQADAQQEVAQIAASLRKECESDDSLDDNTAAVPATAAQLLPEATAAPVADAHPGLKNLILKKAHGPCNPETLALIHSAEFKKRIQEALDEDALVNLGLYGSVSCKGMFDDACKKVCYDSSSLASENKKGFRAHCVSAHITPADLSVITSLIKTVEAKKGKKTMYQCGVCPNNSILHKAQVQLHIARIHILAKPAAQKLPAV